MFKSVSKFMRGIRQGKGSSLKKQKKKEDWLNGIEELKVKKHNIKKHNIDTRPNENTPRKPAFVPKTIVLTKKERLEVLITKLMSFINQIQSESVIITNASKCEATRKSDDLINKLTHLSNDKETRKNIANAKRAVNQYCKRPSSIKPSITIKDKGVRATHLKKR
jgi:hypothetical protein